MEELSIKVNIADRFYPLVVQGEQEETVRKAARLINDKLKVLQQQFAVKDKQDMLAMTVLELTTELLELQNSIHVKEEGLTRQVHSISELLREVKL